MKFSVITICYNIKNEIIATMQSVLSQTYTDYEYIVVDGGSTDGTVDIIKSFKDKFDAEKISFKYVSEKDGGIYDAMNKGIKMSKGDYLVFMNGGDVFYNETVLESVNSKSAKNTDVIYGDTVIRHPDGHEATRNKTVVKSLNDFRALPFCHQSAFVKNDTMKKYGYDTNYKICADLDFFTKVYASGGTYEYLPLYVAVFSLDGGISSKAEYRYKMEKEHLTINRKYGIIGNGSFIVKLIAAKFRQLKSILKKFLKRTILKIISAFCKYCPKSKKIWIFGAWGGKLYADNSKYFFEYVNENNKKIKAVWISKSPKAVADVREKGYRAYKEMSVQGIWYTARAAIAVETEGEWDISQFLSYKHTKIIQLWHGMGAKAMNWKKNDNKTRIVDGQERYNMYHWMSPSELYTDTISDLLSVDKSRFTLTGYPRNDMLVLKPENKHMESLQDQYKDSKFIIYMPTHRNFGKEGSLANNLSELIRVDEELQKNNIVMVYKPHIHELKNLLSYEDNFKNIILAKEQDIWGDVYSYLHYFDAIISDYSSITTDFMCLERPVILFAFDLEDYKKGDAGLNEYFYRIPGGPICYTWDETIDETVKLLKEDTLKEERERCRKEYHFYNDGKNSERVYKAVINILK